MLPLRHAGLFGVAIALTACIDVSFSSGGDGGSGSTGSAGGPSTSTSTSSSGGASGTGGATTTSSTMSSVGGAGGGTTTTSGAGDCTNKRCGPDGAGGLCNGQDMQPTWSISVGGPVRQIVAWPETQSILVTTSNDRVLRIDECDGSIMAQRTTTGGADGRPFLLGAGLYGSTLLVVGAKDANGSNPDRSYTIDAASTDLAILGTTTLQGYFSGAMGHAYADTTGLVVNLDEGAQGFIPTSGTACSSKFGGYGNLSPRGITRTATATYALKFYPFVMQSTIVSSCATTCACGPAPKDATSSTGVLYNAIADMGTDLVAVGTNAQTDAYIVRVNASTLAQTDAIGFNIDPGNGQDALLDATVSGGFVFAGGATALSTTAAYSIDPNGLGVVLRVPTTFSSTTTPSVATLTGSQRVRVVEADSTGLYAGGTSTGGGLGFIAKCTTALDCDPLP
jgi:hypothetical protein